MILCLSFIEVAISHFYHNSTQNLCTIHTNNLQVLSTLFHFFSKVSFNYPFIFLFYIQAGRGSTYDQVYVDEAGHVPSLSNLLSYASLDKTKLLLTSSVNTASETTCALLKLKDSGAPYYHVTFCCPLDVEKIANAKHAVACHHYILAPPPHIVSDEIQKKVMNTLESDSFFKETMGVISEEVRGAGLGNGLTASSCILGQADPECLFVEDYLCNMETRDGALNTLTNRHCMSRKMWMYIDPAYTDRQTVSATGIAIITYIKGMSSQLTPNKTKQKSQLYGVVLAIEQYWLPSHDEIASGSIAGSAARAVLKVLNAHRYRHTKEHHFKELVVAIESNSSEHMAVHIARSLNAICALALSSKFRVSFVHRPVNSTDAKLAGCQSVHDFGTREVVGYWLGGQKNALISNFQEDFNMDKIRASILMYSYTIKKPHNFLADQLRKFRRGSKPKDGSQNDVAIALIMAYNMMLNRSNDQVAHLIHPLIGYT